eukprot:TRINITY_DN10334_c0_g1_i3.p1 TRINITY_DN10334_c0_g1~~TRINITY_DN10334_c0_g1_i3.p1  ORF type:complete len:296 (-),score=55.72 TRINITY_DN10334_c0_g1_i3:91-978(-)
MGNLNAAWGLTYCSSSIGLSQARLGELEFAPGAFQKCTNTVRAVCLIEHSLIAMIADRDENGRARLHQAALCGNLQAVVDLLHVVGGNSADLVNPQDAFQQTPLLLAAEKGHAAVVLALIKHEDTLVGLQDKFGRTALHWCAQHGDVEAVSALLDRQAPPAPRTTGGDTPLHWAITSKDAAPAARLRVAQLLLGAGADAAARNESGSAPLDLAQQQRDAAMAQLLTQHITHSEAQQEEELAAAAASLKPASQPTAETGTTNAPVFGAKAKWGGVGTTGAAAKPREQKKLKISLKK